MISQIFIIVLGIPTFFLISRPESWRRWGFVLGLISQPFWYYQTITHQQWGIFILSLFYTYTWCQGIYFGFVKK